eukprot:g1994.t1
MVEQHYRPPRNGAERTLQGSSCVWCCEVVDSNVNEAEIFCEPTEAAGLSDAMRAHLAHRHPVAAMGPGARAMQQDALRAAKEKDRLRGEAIRSKVVEELTAGGDVSEVQQKGPKRPGRATYVDKLKCHVCNLSFTTSAGAMKLHMDGHARGDYTKIGQLCHTKTLEVKIFKFLFRVTACTWFTTPRVIREGDDHDEEMRQNFYDKIDKIVAKSGISEVNCTTDIWMVAALTRTMSEMETMLLGAKQA